MADERSDGRMCGQVPHSQRTIVGSGYQPQFVAINAGNSPTMTFCAKWLPGGWSRIAIANTQQDFTSLNIPDMKRMINIGPYVNERSLKSQAICDEWCR
jgi:hypothetical protein